MTIQGVRNNTKKWYSDACKKTKDSLKIDNPMAVSRIKKIVINAGLKEAVSNTKIIDVMKKVLRAVTDQEPKIALARKSIAGFKIRENMPIGVFVTLRGDNMLNFLRKLIDLALPRVRDFQGVKVSFDHGGNYNLGIKDITIFPEAEGVMGNMHYVGGVNVTVAFEHSIKNTKERAVHAHELLKSLGMPFVRKEAK